MLYPGQEAGSSRPCVSHYVFWASISSVTFNLGVWNPGTPLCGSPPHLSPLFVLRPLPAEPDPVRAHGARTITWGSGGGPGLDTTSGSSSSPDLHGTYGICLNPLCCPSFWLVFTSWFLPLWGPRSAPNSRNTPVSHQMLLRSLRSQPGDAVLPCWTQVMSSLRLPSPEPAVVSNKRTHLSELPQSPSPGVLVGMFVTRRV